MTFCPGRSPSGVKLLNLDTDDKVAIATVIPRRPQSKRPVGTLLQYPPLLFGPHMYMSPQRRREEDRPCLICGRNAGWNEDPRISAAMITCDLCGRFRFNSITELYLGGPAFQEDLRRYKVSYVQPVGVVVSTPALLEAGAAINRNFVPLHKEFLAVLPQESDGTTIPKLTDFPAFATDVLGWRPQDLEGPDESLTIAVPG